MHSGFPWRAMRAATAVEIGVTMVVVRRDGFKTRATLERMGLEMATALVRAGDVVPTRCNRFVLTRFAKQAVPPAVEVEDTPAPGFMRVAGR